MNDQRQKSQPSGLAGCRSLLIFGATLVAGISSTQAAPQEIGQLVPKPDAGQLLRNAPSPAWPDGPQSYKGMASPPQFDTTSSRDEMAVDVYEIRIQGNHLFSTEQLKQAIPALSRGDVKDHASMTLKQLKDVANQVTQYYRGKGYFIAFAYLPPQVVTDGKVTMEVLEGKIDQVRVGKSGAYAPEIIQHYAQQALCGNTDASCTGSTLSSDKADRAIGLISDLPGVAKVEGVLKPGSKVGTSDITLDAVPGSPYVVSLGADNYGQKYTGRERATSGLRWNNPAALGDQLTLDVTTSGDMTTGSVDYSLPFGYDGWRAGLDYEHMLYSLRAPFDDLNAYGLADTLTPYVSYPIIRHPDNSLTGKVSYISRWLSDSSLGVKTKKQEQGASFDLSGSMIDRFGGGGITAYDVALTLGHMNYNDQQTGSPSIGNGSFTKLAGTVQRDQTLTYFQAGQRLSLYAALRGQASNTNLPSVEQFSLGGPDSVRAYPVGEAQGDEGVIATAELRYSFHAPYLWGSDITPSLFHDQGWVQTAHSPWEGFQGPTSRHLGGTGVGIELERHDSYSIKLTAAFRNAGGEPDTSSPDSSYWIWLQTKYFF